MRATSQSSHPTRRYALVLIMATVVAIIAAIPALVGRAAAPSGRYAIAADTVDDTITKLTWQRAPSSQLQNWSDASTHCQSLALDGGGWRLPTISELESLVDVSRYNWALDPNAFPKPATALDDRFWSASPAAHRATNAWYVDFYHGNSNTTGRSSSCYVRCVR